MLHKRQGTPNKICWNEQRAARRFINDLYLGLGLGNSIVLPATGPHLSCIVPTCCVPTPPGLDTAFMFSYAVGSFFSGSLGDRLYPPMVVGMGLIGSFACLMVLVVAVKWDLMGFSEWFGSIILVVNWVIFGVMQVSQKHHVLVLAQGGGGVVAITKLDCK